jgi:hypothetical protein
MNRRQRRAAASKARHREHSSRPSTGYIHRLWAARVGGAVPRAGLFHSLIEHDTDCGIWSGGGCTCVPNISISMPDSDSVVVVDERGNTRKVARS